MTRDNTHSIPSPVPAAQRLVLNEASSARSAATSKPLLSDAHPLHGIQAQLEVCIGTAQIALGDLMSVDRQSVLVLDRGLNEPVDLMLNGKVVARGELIAVDGKFGVRISEVPLPLTLAPRA